MEYRAESEITYTACTGIEIENMSAGKDVYKRQGESFFDFLYLYK